MKNKRAFAVFWLLKPGIMESIFITFLINNAFVLYSSRYSRVNFNVKYRISKYSRYLDNFLIIFPSSFNKDLIKNCFYESKGKALCNATFFFIRSKSFILL